MRSLFVLILLLLAGGCQPKSNAKSEESTKSETGIFGKTTGDIGKFDPAEGLKVSEGKVDEKKLQTPLIGSLAAYGPALEKLSKMHIHQAVELFNAAEGRYPKDYDEFMEKIVAANQIQLPVLPGNLKYQYDVEKHELVIVESPPEQDK